MKKLLLALALCLAPTLASAQCTGIFPNNTLCGNISGASAPPGIVTIAGTVVIGPVSSTVGDAAVWNNTSGTLLKDTPFLQVYGTQSANTIFSGPITGSAAFPTWRALVNADVPTALTGKTIDNSIIGGTTPAAGTFTNVGIGTATLTKLLNIGANASIDSSGNIIASNITLSGASGIVSSQAGNFPITAASTQQVVIGTAGGTGSIVMAGGGSPPTLYPSPDNTVQFGNSGARWSAGYFGATASTSVSTGSVVVSGGVGIGGAAWIGGLLNVVGVPTVTSTTATPAGGSTAARLLFGTTSGFGIYYGSGVPTVSAAQGSIYLRSDGSGSGTRAYINSNGSTTWASITTGS